METEKYLMALEEVVSKRYSSRMYNIGGYQEAAICLQSDVNNGGWIVYNGERGNKYNIVSCNTILKACLEFIRKFTHRVEDISAMENELLNILMKAA